MANHWFPEGCGVLVVTQDGTLDLSDVSWQEVAPCGCVCGVTMAATGKDEILTSPEQAGRSMCGTSARYDRDVEQGTTWRPREHRAAAGEMSGDCPHQPKWGIEPPPKPEGMTWAAVHCLGSSPLLTHLVSAEHVARVAAGDFSAARHKPLCGGKEAYWWKDEWYATDGKVECKRCAAKAKAALAVSA